jgi:3-methyladenine DNA glycosylase AlkD
MVKTPLQRQLFALQDKDYKQFNQKLLPTVDPAIVIGVRTPALRRLARDFAKKPEAEVFLEALPHTYYEENNLHAFIIETFKDYDRAMAGTEAFLPYVDNWATCDSFSPKVFKKYPAAVYEKIITWLDSPHDYTVRYGVGLLLSNYLDEAFEPEMAARVAKLAPGRYYVDMMCAWYMATGLVKQPQAFYPYLTEGRLNPWVHNKTIQKAVESRRVTPQEKDRLRALHIPRER